MSIPKYVNGKVKEWCFELVIVKRLHKDGKLDHLSDQQLEEFIQNRLNDQYGVKTEGCCFKLKEVPMVYCRINTLNKAKNAMERDRQRHLFWQPTLGNSLIEQQWVRDFEYLQKYKGSNRGFDSLRMLDMKNYIHRQRIEDPQITYDHAGIFITDIKIYNFFKNKLDEHKNNMDIEEIREAASAPPITLLDKN